MCEIFPFIYVDKCMFCPFLLKHNYIFFIFLFFGFLLLWKDRGLCSCAACEVSSNVVCMLNLSCRS